MKTKFAVGCALCALVGTSGLSMAQEAPKSPSKAVAPTAPKPLKVLPQEHAVDKATLKQDAKIHAKPEAPAAGDMDKMMQEMMSLAKEHEYLKQYVGSWTADVTMYEGGQESKSTATATFTELFGGRFVQSEFKSDMMGMPFMGHQIVGYNKSDKKFESLWVDSMSTGFYLATGTADSTGKVITSSGMMDDPMAGGKTKMREVTTFDGKGTMTFEMFATHDGNEAKMMKIVYTKATGATKPTAEGHGAALVAPAAAKPVEKK